MTTRSIHIRNGEQIPADWGEPRTATRRTTVAIREPAGIETFWKSWGTLTARLGEDWVVMEDSGAAYPVKKAIFARTWQEVAPGRYRKIARSRLVQVPPGVVAVLATREGDLEVTHPDYVVIGAEGEVYANSAAWVAENLEFET
ncbi:MAG: hypothetical protein PHQ14_10985 [Chromatiales bacterium]|nr:hypothetical protein [Chromatiales bacterium]